MIAPVCAALLYLPNVGIGTILLSTKISVLLVWLPAMVSVYYNLKHAIIPDCDFGFVKAIKPYNVLAVALGFAELFRLTAWNCLHNALLVITSILFAALCVAMMIAAKKGAENQCKKHCKKGCVYDFFRTHTLFCNAFVTPDMIKYNKYWFYSLKTGSPKILFRSFLFPALTLL